MSWKQRTVSLVLLVVLTGLPVAGATCALLCGSGVSNRAHHGVGAQRGSEHTGAGNCQESPTSGDVRMGRFAEHDCSHEATIRQIVSFAADRADALLRSAPAVSAFNDRVIVPLDVEPESTYIRPPGTDPPTSTPLVLRV